MSNELDDFDKTVLRDFLGDNWTEFYGFCNSHGINPEEIYVKLGGEAE